MLSQHVECDYVCQFWGNGIADEVSIGCPTQVAEVEVIRESLQSCTLSRR